MKGNSSVSVGKSSQSHLTILQTAAFLVIVGLSVVSFCFNFYRFILPVKTSYGYSDVGWGADAAGMVCSVLLSVVLVPFVLIFRKGEPARRILLIISILYASAVAALWLTWMQSLIGWGGSPALWLVLLLIMTPFYGLSYFFRFDPLNAPFVNTEDLYWISMASFRLCFTAVIALMLVLSAFFLLRGRRSRKRTPGEREQRAPVRSRPVLKKAEFSRPCLTAFQIVMSCLTVLVYCAAVHFNIGCDLRPVEYHFSCADAAWGPSAEGIVCSIIFSALFLLFIIAFRKGKTARKTLQILAILFAAGLGIMWLSRLTGFEFQLLRAVLIFTITPFYGLSCFFKIDAPHLDRFLERGYLVSELSFQLCCTGIIILACGLSAFFLLRGRFKETVKKMFRPRE